MDVDLEYLNELEQYNLIQVLGKGAFGHVVLMRNVYTMELVAIKFLKRSVVNKYVESEIINHSLLRHPHVIQFKEVFLTPQHICIIMEYATGGSLFQYVQKHGRIKESVARWFFQQLIIGVDYCHKRGIANRDLKLENTLLQNCNGLPLPLLKICDFGYSKAKNQSAAKSKVGTLTYMAPEVLVNRDGKYDGLAADIWSCGVMLYVMLCGRYPFEAPAIPKAKEILHMLECMVQQKYERPSNVELSEDAWKLLQNLLLPDPQQRLTLTEVYRHPWFVTNLPAGAANMNDVYLSASFPPGHQSPDDIRLLIEEAKDIYRGSLEAPLNADNQSLEGEPGALIQGTSAHLVSGRGSHHLQPPKSSTKPVTLGQVEKKSDSLCRLKEADLTESCKHNGNDDILTTTTATANAVSDAKNVGKKNFENNSCPPTLHHATGTLYKMNPRLEQRHQQTSGKGKKNGEAGSNSNDGEGNRWNEAEAEDLTDEARYEEEVDQALMQITNVDDNHVLKHFVKEFQNTSNYLKNNKQDYKHSLSLAPTKERESDGKRGAEKEEWKGEKEKKDKEKGNENDEGEEKQLTNNKKSIHREEIAKDGVASMVGSMQNLKIIS